MFALVAVLVSAGCGDGGSTDTENAAASRITTADKVTISEFPAKLTLRPDQDIRVRLVGVNPRNGTVSKLTSSMPDVVRVINQSRINVGADSMTVSLRAGRLGRAALTSSSTPLCACDGPAISLRIDVEVASDGTA